MTYLLNRSRSTEGDHLYKLCRGQVIDASCQVSRVLEKFLKFFLPYRKVSKFSDAGKICCNLPKIQTKSPNLQVFCQKDANGIANSEDPDQTAPLGAV